MSTAPASRLALYSFICRAPGLHFRELVRRTGLAVGALRYHLEVLKKAGVVVEDKEGGRLRLFPAEMPLEQRRLLGLVRTRGLRRIMLQLLEEPRLRHSDVVDRLGFAPATGSWYLKRLEQGNVLVVEIRGRERRYSLRDPNAVREILRTHRRSFADELVDRFLDLFETAGAGGGR